MTIEELFGEWHVQDMVYFDDQRHTVGRCRLCGALVKFYDQQLHLNFHRQLELDIPRLEAYRKTTV